MRVWLGGGAGVRCVRGLGGGLGRWGGEGDWVWAPDQVWGDGSRGGDWGCVRASEVARGRFPLGGGNDEEGGRV